MSNGASRAPQEIRMDLAVLPVAACQGNFNQTLKNAKIKRAKLNFCKLSLALTYFKKLYQILFQPAAETSASIIFSILSLSFSGSLLTLLIRLFPFTPDRFST